MRYQEIAKPVAIVEEIEGHNAVCYHRTNSVEVIQAIGAEGFKIGQDTAATYGRGVYMTYDFRSQQRDRMIETYGDYIIHCQVDLRGFMILDSVVARGVYGDDWHPKDQWRVLGLPRPDLIDGYDTIMKGERYT